MCQNLNDLRQAVLAYASAFDARTLTPTQAGDVVRVCARIEASVASMRKLAAARSAESSSWKAEGHRSAAEKLASDTGTSTSTAKRALEAGRRMANQPTVAKAALAGELSPDQVEAVTDGVAADPGSADALIAKAQEGSLAELNEEVTRIKAGAVDQEQRRRDIHAKRSLRRWTDRDGAFHAHLYGQPDDGTRLWQMIDPVRRRLHLLHDTDSGQRESADALDYDAIMTIADIATGRTTQLDITDLLKLGLFPQLTDATTDTTSATQSGTPATPGTTTTCDAAAAAAGAGAGAGAGTVEETFEAASPSFGAGDATGVGVKDARGGACPSLFEFTTDDRSDTATSDRIAGSMDRSAEAVEGVPTSTDRTEAGPWSSSRSAGIVPDEEPSSGQPPRRVKKLAGSPARVMIRVDLDTLLRGVPLNGELCEIAGYGPIPVSVIKELIANENPFIVGILTKAEQIIGVYHHRRRPNAHQKSALDFLYPTCAAAGCNTRTGLQYDHREDWAKTNYTTYDLLDRLCTHHHNLKTRNNWNLVNGTGKRPFVPPDHPDHPGPTHRRRSETAPPSRSP